MSTKSTIASARTFLFVPGNRPERFEKAARSGADAIVLDLEDAVPAGAKEMARQSVQAAWTSLQALGVPLAIRINSPEVPVGREDLAMVAGLAGLGAVMVPKAEQAATLRSVAAALPGVPIIPLVESAAGYTGLSDIAAVAGAVRLAIGHIDFLADTGLQCSGGEPELDPLRFAVAMATRVNNLAPAVDGVTVDIEDADRLRSDTQRSVRFGFGAKLCIHPKQIPAIHDAFRPSAEQLRWAQRVIEADAASQGAAVQVDGRMVDAPVVLQARRTLARAGQS
ncbi:MAG: CoA ester lyase [Pseudomonas sp.]